MSTEQKVSIGLAVVAVVAVVWFVASEVRARRRRLRGPGDDR